MALRKKYKEYTNMNNIWARVEEIVREEIIFE